MLEPNLACYLGNDPLVIGIRERMHEHDRERPVALVVELLQLLAHSLTIRSLQDLDCLAAESTDDLVARATLAIVATRDLALVVKLDGALLLARV